MSDLDSHGNGKSEIELRQVLSPLLLVFSLSLLVLLSWLVVLSLSLLLLLSLLVVFSLLLLVLLSLLLVSVSLLLVYKDSKVLRSHASTNNPQR